MLGLLVAGSVVLVVGILAIGFGIPVKEFSFGNTLILSGAIVACTGAVLIALSLVLRELKTLSFRLASGYVQPETGGVLRGRLEQFPPPVRGTAASAASPEYDGDPDSGAELPPGLSEDVRANPSDRDAAPEAQAPVKQRRNLLFMSTKRERESAAAAAEAPGPVLDMPRTAPIPVAAEPVSFEDAWPAPDRSRPDPSKRQTRETGAPDAQEATIAVATPSPRRPAEAPPVTILKSGVVDGMAYSLYSDGSIEAQLPEGMIRFASIDELRSHLDYRE
jgi:hypothetical protein